MSCTPCVAHLGLRKTVGGTSNMLHSGPVMKFYPVAIVCQHLLLLSAQRNIWAPFGFGHVTRSNLVALFSFWSSVLLCNWNSHACILMWAWVLSIWSPLWCACKMSFVWKLAALRMIDRTALCGIFLHWTCTLGCLPKTCVLRLWSDAVSDWIIPILLSY